MSLCVRGVWRVEVAGPAFGKEGGCEGGRVNLRVGIPHAARDWRPGFPVGKAGVVTRWVYAAGN